MECHLCLWARPPSVSLWRLISIPWLCPSRIGCARLLFSTTPLSQLQITTTLHHIMPFINTNLIYFLFFLVSLLLHRLSHILLLSHSIPLFLKMFFFSDSVLSCFRLSTISKGGPLTLSSSLWPNRCIYSDDQWKRGGFLLTNGSQDLCCNTERRTGLCRQRGVTQGQVKVGGLTVR